MIIRMIGKLLAPGGRGREWTKSQHQQQNEERKLTRKEMTQRAKNLPYLIGERDVLFIYLFSFSFTNFIHFAYNSIKHKLTSNRQCGLPTINLWVIYMS